MERILVIRGGAIGDFILTLPAIKLLRDQFPQAHIEILGYTPIIVLAEGRFYADANLYEPPPAVHGKKPAGRPRVKGAKRPCPAQVVAHTPIRQHLHCTAAS